MSVGSWVRENLFGAAVLSGLTIALVFFSSLPLIVAVVLASFMDGLRDGLTPWSLLHLLWMVPVAYLLSSAIDAVVRTLWPGSGRVRSVVGFVLTWLSLLVLLQVFIADLAVSAVCALVAAALYLVVAFVGERTGGSGDEEADEAGRAAS